jgi:hypothetical protein
MARYDDLSTGPIAYAAFVSTIILVVIILLVRALCYSWVEAEDSRKLAEAHYTSADVVIAEQKSKISSYGKQMVEVAAPEGSDPAAPASQEERLLIPVNRAKEVLLQDWSSQK